MTKDKIRGSKYTVVAKCLLISLLIRLYGCGGAKCGQILPICFVHSMVGSGNSTSELPNGRRPAKKEHRLWDGGIAALSLAVKTTVDLRFETKVT
jgi:hypothetical protein